MRWKLLCNIGDILGVLPHAKNRTALFQHVLFARTPTRRKPKVHSVASVVSLDNAPWQLQADLSSNFRAAQVEIKVISSSLTRSSQCHSEVCMALFHSLPKSQEGGERHGHAISCML